MKNTPLLKALLLISTALTFVACEKPLSDYQTEDIPADFQALAKPVPGKGYQIHIEPFPVQANYEREFYIRKQLGNTEEVYLNGFEMRARPGTHHMIAYSFGKDDFLPKENVMFDQNMPNNTLAFRSATSIGGALFQSPQANYKFNLPAGYALTMAPNTSFLMNSHYFNKTDKTRFGELFVNFYTTPKNEVNQLLNVEYLSPDEISLPAGKKTVMTTDFIMDKETVIPMMLSHYHKRGEKFEVRIKGGKRDGELIYESEYYDDPKVATFEPALNLKAGEGLTSVVTYDNNSTRNLTFGVTSEDEMNIVIIFKYHPNK